MNVTQLFFSAPPSSHLAPSAARSPSIPYYEAPFLPFNPHVKKPARALRRRNDRIHQKTHKTYQSTMANPRPCKSTLTNKQRIKLQKTVQHDLFKALTRTIEIARIQWCNKRKIQLKEEVNHYLNHPSMSRKQKERERKKIDLLLQKRMLPKAYEELTGKRLPVPPAPTSPKEKRSSAQQTIPPLLLQEQPIDPNATAPYDQLKACSSGNQVTIVGATQNTINTTHANAQRVRFITQQAETIQVLDNASEAASALLPPRQGANNVGIACDPTITDIITEDPTQGYFHTRVTNQTISVPQYIVQSYNLTTRPASSTAWDVARLLKNASTIAPIFSNSYYAFYTNSSNQFPPIGPNLKTFSSGLPTPQRLLSFTDGSFHIFQDWGQVNQIFVRTFNSFRSLTGTASINLNQTISGIIKTLPIGPRTPQPMKGQSILLIVPIDKGGGQEGTVVLEYQPSQQQIISAIELPPITSLLNGKVSVASCPDMPNIFITTRDAAETIENQTQFTTLFNVFNATNGTYSLTDEQMDATNSTLPPQSEAGCLPNGTGLVIRLKDGSPFLLPFKFLNQNAFSPTPTPRPAPAPAVIPVPSMAPSPLESPSPSAADISIIITFPIDLGVTPIPVTDVIQIGKDIETIKFINLYGFEFFFPNGTLVTQGITLSVGEFNHLTLSKGNATQGTVPNLEGCDAQGNCLYSTADAGRKSLFIGDGSTILLVSILSAVGVVIIAIGGTAIAYYQCIDKIAPFRKRKKAEEADRDRAYERMD